MKLANLLLILASTLALNVYAAQVDTLTNEVTTVRSDRNATPTPQEDKIITQSIMNHIQNSSVLSNLNVNVQTHRGIVTLSGNVDSDSQASSLIELSQSIIGVKDVNAGNLKVRASQQPFKDMMTTAKIKGLFIKEDVFGTKDIASVNISVETKNGVVYLTGAVSNQDQVKNAINLIKGVKGVKKVVYKFQKVITNGTTPTT